MSVYLNIRLVNTVYCDIPNFSYIFLHVQILTSIKGVSDGSTISSLSNKEQSVLNNSIKFNPVVSPPEVFTVCNDS